MNFEDLMTAAKISDHVKDVLAHAVSTFRPGTDTEGKPPVPTTAGNPLGTVVPVVMREKLCYAVHLVEGRVIGMERQFLPSGASYAQQAS
jgi:hypothetical protein